MTEPLTIVVADVDVLVTDFLLEALENHGFRAVIAPPVSSAVGDWVRKYAADVCIINLALRDDADIATIAGLVAEFPETRFIVRTSDTSAEPLRAALDAGVAGYVHKSRGLDVLLESIVRVAGGEVVVEGSFARSVAPNPNERADFYRRVRILTPRQQECLRMMSEGKGTDAMASELGVSAMTVRTHVQATLTKLGVKSRVEAVSLVARHRLPEMM